MYRRLVADRPDVMMAIVHPDPDVDLARVAAKKLLCQAARGETPPTPADLEEFNRRFPKSAGSLGGTQRELSGDTPQIDRLGSSGSARSARFTMAHFRRSFDSEQDRSESDRCGIASVASRA